VTGLPILSRVLHDKRKNLLGWMLGMALYLAMIMALWPTIRDSEGLQQSVEDYPEALKNLFGGSEGFDYTSAAGYLNTQVFALVLPIMLAVFGIGLAASVLAGEEENGKLDLVLANPVTRRRLLLEKALGILLLSGLLVIVVLATMLIFNALLDMQVSVGDYLAAVFGAFLLATVYSFIALGAGAVRGRRGLAIGAASAALGLGYLMQVVAGISSSLEWLKYLSPFFYATGSLPIMNGLPLGHAAVLVAVLLVTVLVSLASFDRRDLGR
jgi:beta-exotoxin I transport system permease protein